MEFDSEKFERRLLNLKDTQDSITLMSKWCLSKRVAHKQIVKSWLKILKEVKIEQRLTLFYLANDVIQHSKRKGYEFVDSWATALQRASTLVRDDARVKEKISRIFNIWQQREVYAEDFISDLHGLLHLSLNQVKNSSSSASTSISASPVSSSPNRLSQSRFDDYEDEFQLSTVVSSIRNCISLESETDKNLKDAVKQSVPNMEKVKSSLKDRSLVEDLERDLEIAGKKYELFIESQSAEIKARKILLTALDQAEKFYRNQRRDVKKVVYAYKNFGDRIKSIHTELNNKMINLPSPIPSPDINAPSPEPENDFDLPSDLNFYNSNMNGTFGSFMNNDQLPFDLNEFYRESPPPVEHNQSIQVVQTKDQQSSQQPTAPLNDFYNSLLPQKMDSYNPTAPYIDSYRQQPPPPLPATASAQPMNYAYNSLIPPPPPPQNNQSMNSSNDDYSWTEWSDYNETPVSPPHFERKGHEDSMVEYVDDSLRDLDTSLNDIDQRQLFVADMEIKDIDHRNLISLTGSPGESQNVTHHPTNGNKDYMPPLLETPPINFMPPCDQHPPIGVPNFPPQNRNPRPPLLPTPNIPPQRFGHSISMNSDTSQGIDDMESSEVDMDLSDDDGMDNKHLPNDPFYNMNQQPRFPHQPPMNRPPPPIPITPENDLVHQTKPWIMNKSSSDMQQHDEELSDVSTTQSLLTPPPNFMSHQSNRNFPRGGGNFRGQNRNMNLNKSNSNNAPYNNFKGNRGRGGGGRGNFRGNFRGQW